MDYSVTSFLSLSCANRVHGATYTGLKNLILWWLSPSLPQERFLRVFSLLAFPNPVQRRPFHFSAAPMPRHVPISKQSLLLNLDKGLDSFFPRSTAAILEESAIKDGELDLNSIEQTDMWVWIYWPYSYVAAFLLRGGTVQCFSH